MSSKRKPKPQWRHATACSEKPSTPSMSTERCLQLGQMNQGTPSILGSHDLPVNLIRQRVDVLGKPLGLLGQLRVRLEQLLELSPLLEAPARKLLAVERVCYGAGLVPIGLPCLREQDQWRRVRRLRREGEVEQDERIGVPAQPGGDGVQRDPDDDDERLADEELRRAEEAREGLGSPTEGVAAERRGEMHVRLVEAKGVFGHGLSLSSAFG